MAIGGIGPLSTPVNLTVENGEVQNLFSKEEDLIERVAASLETDNMANVVGEFAFGINRKARFTQEFLEAEKIFGTIHIAFGNNSDYPEGKNNSKTHMDFLVSKPTVNVNDSSGVSSQILVDGIFNSEFNLST